MLDPIVEWMAEEQVIFVHADGRRAAGRIAVGRPAWIDDDLASCAVALDGLHQIPHEVYGATPLQALMLAMQMFGGLLHNFITKGGRILHDDESEFPAGAYFGGLLRAPQPIPTTD